MALRAIAFGAAVSCELLVRELNAIYTEHASSLVSFLVVTHLKTSASHVKPCTCKVDTTPYHEGDAQIHSDPVRSSPIQS